MPQAVRQWLVDLLAGRKYASSSLQILHRLEDVGRCSQWAYYGLHMVAQWVTWVYAYFWVLWALTWTVLKFSGCWFFSVELAIIVFQQKQSLWPCVYIFCGHFSSSFISGITWTLHETYMTIEGSFQLCCNYLAPLHSLLSPLQSLQSLQSLQASRNELLSEMATLQERLSSEPEGRPDLDGDLKTWFEDLKTFLLDSLIHFDRF